MLTPEDSISRERSRNSQNNWDIFISSLKKLLFGYYSVVVFSGSSVIWGPKLMRKLETLKYLVQKIPSSMGKGRIKVRMELRPGHEEKIEHSELPPGNLSWQPCWIQPQALTKLVVCHYDISNIWELERKIRKGKGTKKWGRNG